MNRQLIASALLASGALLGVALAGAGLLEPNDGIPDGSVARVNEATITDQQFEQYVSLINASSRSEKERAYVLERMIDEELLVQRGVELGMVELNSTVRNSIVQAVTRRFVKGVDGTVTNGVPEAELKRFYEDNKGYFTPASQYTVEVLAPEGFPLPEKPLTETTLTEYLGPTATRAVIALEPGDTTEIESGGRVFQLRMIDKNIGTPPPLDKIRNAVAREYERQQSQQAFDDYLDWLRDRAEIEIDQRFH